MSRTIEVKFTDRPALSNSILLLTMMFFSATAFADKPEWAGRGDDGEKSYKHEKKHEKKYRKKEDREDDEHEDHHEDHHRHYDRHQSSGSSIEINIGGYFGETQRSETREYYSERISSGHCPPGLKKKRNGCVPPGHSKQWVIGESAPAARPDSPIGGSSRTARSTSRTDASWYPARTRSAGRRTTAAAGRAHASSGRAR